ncbi:MAG: hypothetical protein RIR18_747 [Pseudomonadota bacterium]|jgi:hypothetical protein
MRSKIEIFLDGAWITAAEFNAIGKGASNSGVLCLG